VKKLQVKKPFAKLKQKPVTKRFVEVKNKTPNEQ
jgi:hypothetical protein